MNILILGDSLSFPRAGQRISDTWPCLLQSLLRVNNKIDPVIWFRAHGGSDIRSVLLETHALSGRINEKEFDYAIVQVGIVDCTPRPYPRFIANVLNSNNIGQELKVFIHNHLNFFYFFYSSPNISKKEWRKKIEETAVRLKKLTKQIIFLNIAPPGEVFCKKVPKIESIIEAYNKILHSTIVNMNDEKNMVVMNPYKPDYFDVENDIQHNCGHHLTTTGHQNVSKIVYEYIIKEYNLRAKLKNYRLAVS